MSKEMSPAFSMEGWNIIELLKGQWHTIKEVVKVGAPLFFSIVYFKDNPALIIPITALGKAVLDIAHYYIKKK